jgi:hypothetical protein
MSDFFLFIQMNYNFKRLLARKTNFISYYYPVIYNFIAIIQKLIIRGKSLEKSKKITNINLMLH